MQINYVNKPRLPAWTLKWWTHYCILNYNPVIQCILFYNMPSCIISTFIFGTFLKLILLYFYLSRDLNVQPLLVTVFPHYVLLLLLKHKICVLLPPLVTHLGFTLTDTRGIAWYTTECRVFYWFVCTYRAQKITQSLVTGINRERGTRVGKDKRRERGGRLKARHGGCCSGAAWGVGAGVKSAAV